MVAFEKKDIESIEDIKVMVDSFYDKVNQDELLGPIFNNIANTDWDHHLPKMYSFWNTLIFGVTDYKGQPFPVHAKLPLIKEHFNRWLELFTVNMDENFQGKNAEIAKFKAGNIAYIFQSKLNLLQE